MSIGNCTVASNMAHPSILEYILEVIIKHKSQIKMLTMLLFKVAYTEAL